MTCDCSVDVDCGPRCSSEKTRTARKQHRCIECLEPIEPGERYVNEWGLDYEGDPYSYHTCVLCHRIRRHYCPSGWFWGMLAEHLEDCIGFNYLTGPDDEDDDPWFDGDVPVATPKPRLAAGGQGGSAD
ncbi:MAG: hypothetical protein JRD89_03580 [Deltaproteobacteria bacterium]|nr:hypothetical protein [Deltaproteobacteria bacterium]